MRGHLLSKTALACNVLLLICSLYVNEDLYIKFFNVQFFLYLFFITNAIISFLYIFSVNNNLIKRSNYTNLIQSIAFLVGVFLLPPQNIFILVSLILVTISLLKNIPQINLPKRH